MARLLKRVRLDFDWQLHRVWKGYLAGKPYEPPAGAGYQLWENISEGSPISAVFETLDELCAWAADHATVFGAFTVSKEEWKKILTEKNYVLQWGKVSIPI